MKGLFLILRLLRIVSHLLPKGAYVVVLFSDNGLGNELVAKSLLNDIILKGDMEKYKKVPMEKWRSRSKQLLYEVTITAKSYQGLRVSRRGWKSEVKQKMPN